MKKLLVILLVIAMTIFLMSTSLAASPVLAADEAPVVATMAVPTSVVNLVLIAMFIEAIVQAVKPIWDKTAKKLTVAEIVSMVVGIVIAILAKMNFMATWVAFDSPILIFMMYVFTGIGLGRGPSFLHDLWRKANTVEESISLDELFPPEQG